MRMWRLPRTIGWEFRGGVATFPPLIIAFVTTRLSKLPWLEIAILLLAAALRLYDLAIKPPHFDEGVNGWFVDQMTRNGFFRYDPSNYHGPLHFYAAFLSQTLLGRNLWALRLPAIIASLLGVWMILRFRQFFGGPAARLAALAMAVSPAFVFYGRYSIHESWQVLFSILFLWGIIGLWTKGERRFLYALVLSTAGMIATKETYLLHIGSFVLAGLVLWLWEFVVPSRPATPPVPRQWTPLDLAMAVVLAIFAIVFFYSGNFRDFSSLHGLYQTFAAWFHTGVEAGGHEKNNYLLWDCEYLNFYWLALMARYEWPALLGLAAGVRYAWPSDRRLRFVVIYGAGVLLAYSLIPYKTPWCIISMLWPFLLILGAATAEWIQVPPRWLGWIPAFLAMAASLGECIRLNFFHFDDEKELYVYVQTYRDIYTATDPLLGMAKKDPRYYAIEGFVLLDSYYPLPWLLGDFSKTGYYKKSETPERLGGGFVIVEKSREGEIEGKLSGAYYKRRFRFRDAQEDCIVYFRHDLFAPWFGGEPDIRR